ncbi:MAG: sulfotransferase [Burkholderiaceae bacterium]|nr:sulfotransferase [Burkholderiaceae bacterium]
MKLKKKDARLRDSGSKTAAAAGAHADGCVNLREQFISREEINRLVELFNAGRFVELESRARMAIQQFPQDGFGWKVLGVALKSQGKDALIALKKAAEFLPNDAEAHSNLALALLDLGQLDAAVASCRRALLINPNFAVAHNNLGNALRDLRQLDAAEASCRRALEIDPNLAVAHHGLGVVLRNQGRSLEAEASCRRALEIDPDLHGAITFMAELQADQGRFTEAEALFRRAIVLKPDSPEAWAGFVGVRKMSKTEIGWLQAAQRLADSALPPRAEARLRFAIGKFYDDIQEYDNAFAHYQRANELGKLYGTPYDRRQQSFAVDVLSRVYNRDWIRREQVYANPSARPVFIVGMPRSGTSLAEQILASHPKVFGAGELGFWKKASAIHVPSVFGGQIGEGALNKLARDYLKVLDSHAPNRERVIDKMPDNFLHLGLIHATFPNARIIHMQRNPIDTCLSVYFQHFNTSHAYANDLEDLVHYYAEYYRLMEHWRTTLPEQTILHVPYEGLVADQEGWTRKMLEFIGMPWDARCIDFHQCDRRVSTASNWQVRQKINKTSVERWRHYEKFVGPLEVLTELDCTTGRALREKQKREGEGTLQLLGNILQRAEQSLRTDDGDWPLFDAPESRARRTAELAMTTAR